MLRKIFRSQKFRGATLEEEGSKGQPWKKKVPTTSREWSQHTTIFGHQSRERNAAWQNRPPQRGELAPLEPLKEKRQAPVPRQKTSRNLARTNPKRQPLDDGLKTAKHHLNPASDEAKNRPPQRAELSTFGTPKGEETSPSHAT